MVVFCMVAGMFGGLVAAVVASVLFDPGWGGMLVIYGLGGCATVATALIGWNVLHRRRAGVRPGWHTRIP